MIYFRQCILVLMCASWISFFQDAKAQDFASSTLALSGTGTLNFDASPSSELRNSYTTLWTTGNVTLVGGTIELDGATNYIEMSGSTITNSGTLTLTLGNLGSVWSSPKLTTLKGSYDLLPGGSLDLVEGSSNGTANDPLVITLLGNTSGFNNGTLVNVVAAPEPRSIKLGILALLCFFGIKISCKLPIFQTNSRLKAV